MLIFIVDKLINTRICNSKEMRFLARGPLLLSTSLIPIVVPILGSIKITTTLIIAIVLFSFGLYFTASDFAFWIKSWFMQFKKRIKTSSSSIVLDVQLRELFSLDPSVGLIGYLIATFFSMVGLYSFPFTKNQRIKLVQTILPAHFDAETLLFTPGGFWDYVTKADVDQHQHDLELNFHRNADQNELNDLLFNECASVGVDETEADSLTEDDATRPEISLGGIQEHDGDSLVTIDHCTRYHNSSRKIQPTQTQSNTQSDPIELIQTIVSEYIHSIFKRVNNEQLRRVAFVASMSLLIQLRISKTARKVLLNSMHASLSLGLLGVISSAIATMRMKELIKKTLRGKCDSDSDEIYNFSRTQRINYVTFATSRLEAVNKTRMIVSDVIDSICRDKKLKRGWKFLAIAVLFMFRKRSLKR